MTTENIVVQTKEDTTMFGCRFVSHAICASVRMSVCSIICLTDLLKVIFFVRSEFTLNFFAQSYALKLLKKTYKIGKNFVKLCQKNLKVTFLQV